MRRISLLQIGFGTVGGALIEQVLDNQQRWRDQLGIDITYGAIAGRDGAVVEPNSDGLQAAGLRGAVARRRARLREGANAPANTHAFASLDDVVTQMCDTRPVIVLDAAAGEETAVIDALALTRGGGVVLSNKAPLALPFDDQRGATLWQHAGPNGRLRYEATCGAGLPVISTLRSLLDTGDELMEISGAVSGTFGAIFSSVAAGEAFSKAVRIARDQGYTEPDPRDDLSGLDVARKGLILARTLGQRLDLSDISIHSLVPDQLAEGPVDQFLDRLDVMDDEIRHRAEEAAAMDASLKYIVRWTSTGTVSAGLRQVPRGTVLGALQGPENIVSFRTVRYDQYPCVVSGPGAGAAVTAAGMAADMLALARELAQ
jgi:homoserine dehydrogenase